ncbi:B3 domain-containing protein [Hordeum vulgare]|nr:B3 domain-containing protein [Hordeum vulgare]
MERTTMPDDTRHPEDLNRLDINEHNTARPNNLLWQIGLFRKVDDHDWKQHGNHRQSFEEDLEKGDSRSWSLLLARVVIGLFSCFSEMEFFTIILAKSSSRQVLPDNFVKMLDGHRPQNMKLRQAGNGLRKMWDVEVVFDTDGSMYLDRGWKQFVRAYDLRHGYFLVFRYDSNATFAVKVFDTTMCRRRYQDDDDAKMEFFTIILEKSSSRQVLPDNFVKMLDGHRPQNMKLRQAGNGLHKLWDVEVVFDSDGSMYLDRGWKQFVRAYDLRHGYFLVFRYDDNATFAVKVFDTTMCRRRYQDDDDASNGSRSGEYCDRCYVYGSSDSDYSKSSSDSGYNKSSSDDGLAMVIPQLGDRAMPILVEEYIPQPGLGFRALSA